jgi:hypothetical protein
MKMKMVEKWNRELVATQGTDDEKRLIQKVIEFGDLFVDMTFDEGTSPYELRKKQLETAKGEDRQTKIYVVHPVPSCKQTLPSSKFSSDTPFEMVSNFWGAHQRVPGGAEPTGRKEREQTEYVVIVKITKIYPPIMATARNAKSPAGSRRIGRAACARGPNVQTVTSRLS